MNPISVVVLPEIHEFSLEVLSIPNEGVIKVFTMNRPDEPLNEGMRYSCIRDGLKLTGKDPKFILRPIDKTVYARGGEYARFQKSR